MKIKDGFMLREVAGEWVVIPLGERVIEFSGIMSLSESGAFLWKKMEGTDVSEDHLVKLLLNEYDVDEATARVDVNEFIKTISSRQLVVI